MYPTMQRHLKSHESLSLSTEAKTEGSGDRDERVLKRLRSKLIVSAASEQCPFLSKKTVNTHRQTPHLLAKYQTR